MRLLQPSTSLSAEAVRVLAQGPRAAIAPKWPYIPTLPSVMFECRFSAPRPLPSRQATAFPTLHYFAK